MIFSEEVWLGKQQAILERQSLPLPSSEKGPVVTGIAYLPAVEAMAQVGLVHGSSGERFPKPLLIPDRFDSDPAATCLTLSAKQLLSRC